MFTISEIWWTRPPGDPDIFIQKRRELSIREEALVLFSLGRFIEFKGFNDLLSALALLPRSVHSRPAFTVIAGEGPLFLKLRKQAEDLSLTSRIRWTGWQETLKPYFHSADILVCPSRKETLGNVILEAWAHELPVVSTSTPGAQELIENGHNGLLPPISDPRGLAEQIHEL